MSDKPHIPKHYQWASQIAISKESNRKHFTQHFDCSLLSGQFPFTSLLTIITTSIIFFASAEKYLYYKNTPDISENEFFIFSTNNKWYLSAFLTPVTSFFNATEMQMYISNLLVLVFVAVPLEMVHGSLAIVKLFGLSFLSQILTSFYFSSECKFIIIGSSAAIQSLIYAHMFTITLSWSRLEKPSAILRLIVLAFWLIQDNTWQLYRYYASINSSHPFSPVTMVLAPLIGATYGVVLFYTYRGNDHDEKTDDKIRKRTIKEWTFFGVIVAVSVALLILGVVMK